MAPHVLIFHELAGIGHGRIVQTEIDRGQPVPVVRKEIRVVPIRDEWDIQGGALPAAHGKAGYRFDPFRAWLVEQAVSFDRHDAVFSKGDAFAF